MWGWVGKGAKWLVSSGVGAELIKKLLHRKPKLADSAEAVERCTAVDRDSGLQCVKPAGHAPMHEVDTADTELQWWP